MTSGQGGRARGPAFLFDLDGTLLDSVYQHVVAWHEALLDAGIAVPAWSVHRRIGMSGGLFLGALAHETGRAFDEHDVARLTAAHAAAFERMRASVRPLPGARELLAHLSEREVPWAIATSGLDASARPALALLGAPGAVLVTRDDVRYAKPDPDLFLAAATAIGADPSHCLVVGDSVWDLLAARRARILGLGVMTGGYGAGELERAGAYRVYEDPADLLERLYEVGVRPT